ncbi:MAG: tyrosine-type recombinase/integrase [Candidatus Marinimicrobia bacterium]|nr:tyrosine-type recombinase/integrase [Candidatus Neomarinimicrobiota bacterium]
MPPSPLEKHLLDYGTDTPKLFPGLDTDGKRQKVRKHIQSVLRDAGYEWKRAGCHTFRHTFASHLVINGASIYDVQKLLGHKSIIMTQVYAHLSENATRRAVDLIDFTPKNVTKSSISSVLEDKKMT